MCRVGPGVIVLRCALVEWSLGSQEKLVSKHKMLVGLRDNCLRRSSSRVNLNVSLPHNNTFNHEIYILKSGILTHRVRHLLCIFQHLQLSIKTNSLFLMICYITIISFSTMFHTIHIRTRYSIQSIFRLPIHMSAPRFICPCAQRLSI